uniref:Uncharacterized protein n=1 Tax=Lygus hesperus TaxID=30085 RepID=A0A0A9XSM0_LYGHE
MMQNTANGSIVNGRVLHDTLRDSPLDVHGDSTKRQENGGANEFGSSLAANRTNTSHPYGAGVVWSRNAKLAVASTHNNQATMTEPRSDCSYNCDQAINTHTCEKQCNQSFTPGAAAALSLQHATKSDDRNKNKYNSPVSSNNNSYNYTGNSSSNNDSTSCSGNTNKRVTYAL